MLRRYAVPALVVFGFLSTAQFVVAQERILGVVPQGAPYALASQWQPVVHHLKKSLNNDFRFATASSITRFEQRVLKGDYDYVYVNPLLFLHAEKVAGYRALVRRKNPLRGILVVSKNDNVTLDSLKGSTIAFPSPAALGATILTRAELKRRNIPHQVSYVGTHESGYQGVAVGRYRAAGGVRRTFDLLPDSVRAKLRILMEMKPINGHVIAVHPRVPRAEADKIRRTLVSLHKGEHGAEIMQNLKVGRFVSSMKSDFIALKKLSLPPLRDRSNIAFHVIPRLSAKNTAKQMNPLISYIGQQLELELKLHTYNTMGEFDTAIMKENGVAIINANPLQAIKLAKKGYRIIAQQTPVSSPKGMQGLILVAGNSRYRKLSDLENKRIAFGGNKNAFFASVVPRVLLARAGLHGKYIDASRSGPVSDVVRRLHEGEIDAAGTGAMATNSKLLIEKYGIDKMKVIATSEPMPGLAWLVSKKVPRDIADELRDLLVNFGPAAPGHSSMTSAGIAGLSPASISTYGPVRKYIQEAAHLK